jgi:4-carboxymuconolactone decarboxylase
MMDSQANHTKVPRRTSADIGVSGSGTMAKLEQSGANLTIVRMIANSDSIFRPFIMIADALFFRSVVPRPILEVTILWIARHLDVPYEWAEHVPMALSNGVTQEKVDAIEADDLNMPLFDSEEILAVEVAGQLLFDHELTTSTFDRAVAQWQMAGVIDLIAAIGWWGGTVRAIIEGFSLLKPDPMS